MTTETLKHQVIAELLSRPARRRSKSPMPRWERIGRIHALLEDGACPNATTLSRHLNLVTKTVHRDVAYMREHLGLPVAFDPARNGYYYEQTVAGTPTQPVSEMELFALLVAYRTLAQYAGTELESTLRATFQKFLPQLDTCACLVLDNLREALSHKPCPADPGALAAYSKLCNALAA